MRNLRFGEGLRQKFHFDMPRRKQAWRWLLPILLVLLFLAILIWLPWQARQMEANERREQLIADTLWVEQTVRFQLGRDEASIRLIGSEISSGQLSRDKFVERATSLMRNNHELYRLVWLDAGDHSLASSLHTSMTLEDFSAPSRATAQHAREIRKPLYAPAAPPPKLPGPMLLDYHVPLFQGGHYIGSVVASFRGRYPR